MKYISSAPDKQWVEKEAAALAGKAQLSLNGQVHQTVRGFGGCFNELSQIAMESLTEQQRAEIMDALFSEENGCNFKVCRVSIGANDYAAEWYSCDEVDGDYELKHFNIERDKVYILPYIHEAMKRQPELKLFASPWSPPTWMKFPKAYNFGTLRWEEPVLKAYAEYFVKFVKAYKEQGVTIDQVHVQNEPIADQKFPSCIWTGEQLRDFIKGYLYPAFKAAGMDTEVWLGTLNCPYDNYGEPSCTSSNYHRYAETVLLDDEARACISGVGYQWGGKNAVAQTHESFPELRLMQTENECGDGKNTWDYMEYMFDMMRHYFRNGVEAYTYWNMVLKQGGISTWGWEQNSMICVDEKTGTYTFNPEYYLMRHVAGFVKPGAKVLGVKGHFAAETLAFENPNGEIVLMVHNGLHTEYELHCDVKGGFTAVLAPHSLNTFVL